MDGLKIDEAVIGGLSMGGYVTFAMYRLEPSRFSGMMLADTRSQAGHAPGARRTGDDCARCSRRTGRAASPTQMLPKLLGETTRRERPDVRDGDARDDRVGQRPRRSTPRSWP